MPTQHIATLLGATCCVRLATVLRHVARCWVLLAQIWLFSNLSQQHPTRRNTSQHGGQTHATCCAQQCCDMLRWHVAIVWPGLNGEYRDRVFMSRNYWLIVAPWKFDVLKTSIFALEASLLGQIFCYSGFPKETPELKFRLRFFFFFFFFVQPQFAFSSPEVALLLVSTKNRDLWPRPTTFRF